MDEKSLKVLEWPKIRELVAAKTSFSLSRQEILKLLPSKDRDEVCRRLGLTTEAARLLQKKGAAPFGGATDIKAVVDKASLGGILEPDQLLAVQGLLYCTAQLKRYLSEAAGDLLKYGDSLQPLANFRAEIERCIDDDARLKDGASAELGRIRSRMRTLANRIRERLDSLIQSPSVQKILQDPIVTIRNGRYVVPVRSEYRARFKGIVHDQSASGATLFMEPAFAVELNNDLHVEEQKEAAEEMRILKDLSGRVAAESQNLLRNLKTVTELDCIFAKARYSREIEGIEPEINTQGYLDIKQARHPLLKGEVVPIDVWLGRDFRILVITGPNTGGKTVTLKTVGLLVAMAQSGLHIPAALGSTLAVFTGIHADIGDEQSIEQSLSTFSSHMTNIVGILENLTDNSLVLLDELGAGTDPTEGAALAIAILEHLRRLNVPTIATTHYSDLKSYAYMHDNVENASVEFDLATLEPTFRLSIGIPGKSNAFAISRRLGLQSEIVQNAQSLLSVEHRQAEDMISEMEANRRRAEHERLAGERFKKQYEKLKTEYETLLNDLKEEKDEIIAAARAQALQLMEEGRQELNRILGQVRRLEKEDLAASITAYREKVAERSEELKSLQKAKPKAAGPADLKAGEKVHIKSLRQSGFVLSPPTASGDVQVQAGIMKVIVDVGDLVRDEAPKTSLTRKSGGIKKAHLAKSSTISSEIDLRGKTVQEGLALIDKYLDDAFLSSLGRVRIIHGKGTGALGNAVQDFLGTHPHVREFSYGAPNEGGHGVTVVQIHLPS